MRAASVLLLLPIFLGGCARGEALPGHAGRPDVPRLLGPSEVVIRGHAQVGAVVENTFSPEEGVAVGFMTELARGATLAAELTADSPSELFAYGPVGDGGWFGAPVAARDGGAGRLEIVAPSDGLYLVAALGPPGSEAPFSLSLYCEAGICGGPPSPGAQCPDGTGCDWAKPRSLSIRR